MAKGLLPGYEAVGVVMARLTLSGVTWTTRSAGKRTNLPLPSSITQLETKDERLGQWGFMSAVCRNVERVLDRHLGCGWRIGISWIDVLM